MCRPFSCIVHRTKGVLVNRDPANHSHSDIIRRYKLTDTRLVNRDWVKIEHKPFGDQTFRTTPPSQWGFNVDEVGTLPSWFSSNQARYVKMVVKAAEEWLAKDKPESMVKYNKRLAKFKLEQAAGRKVLASLKNEKAKICAQQRALYKKMSLLYKQESSLNRQKSKVNQKISDEMYYISNCFKPQRIKSTLGI